MSDLQKWRSEAGVRLRPCPFCGDVRIHIDANKEGYVLMCPNCFASVFFVEGEEEASYRETLDSWNARAGEELAQSVVERMGYVGDS